MEMQSILTQIAGAFSVSSQGNNTDSSKVEGKGKMSFQDYMSGASKQRELTTTEKQNTGDDGNTPVTVQQDTHDTLSEKSIDTADTMESSDNTPITADEVKETVTQEEQNQTECEVEEFSSEFATTQTVVQEWKEEVEEILCEEFELTPEELEEIMAEVGVQLADLQNLSNLQQFVLKVVGAVDKTELLTNEVLAKQVISLHETIEQITAILTQEYGVESNEMADYLTQDANLQAVDNVMMTQDMLPAKEEVLSQQIDQEDMISGGKSEATDIDSLHGISSDDTETTVLQQRSSVDVLQQEETNDISTEASVVSLEESDTSVINKTETLLDKKNVLMDVDGAEEKTEPKIEVTMDRQVGKAEENSPESEQQFSHSNKRDNSQSLFEHFVENLSVNRTGDVQQADIKLDTMTQMREIVMQVVEQIKVHMSADTSSMEMQLNPENLGKVNLTVVAKEGHITAQIITENEIARQALDGQIQQLRETLGEQGLKVDEVEVTVSNFDFSHSNQANAEEQRQQQSQEQRRVHKNLNLKDSVSLKDLTEEEQLAARIMADNGNQIDYTA